MFEDEESTMTWPRLLLLSAVGLVMWVIIINRALAWIDLIRR